MQNLKNNKLSVIYDVSYPFIKGGGQKRFYEVLINLSNIYDIYWYTFKAWPDCNNSFNKKNIKYISVGNLPNLYNSSGKRSKIEPIIFLYGILKKLRVILKSDIIWVGQWPFLHLIPLIFLQPFFKFKFVVDWWEVWPKSQWISYSKLLGPICFYLQVFFLKILIKISVIVTDSKIEKKRILDIVGKKYVSKVFYIPNGIYLNFSDTLTRKNYFPVIASIGRLKDHKKIDILIEAISILRTNYNRSIKLNIIGTGPELSNLKKLSKNLNVNKLVTFFGHVKSNKKISKILINSSIGAVTTISGGAGNLVIMEMYSYGLPVIAFKTDEGIDPNLIKLNKTGWFVNKVSAYDLAKKINFVFSNQNLIRCYSKNAINLAKQNHWSYISEKYEQILIK